ncbi:hypothetical protein JCM10908_001305 [Rhodotorula pacifica]|uniref:uncharacterized protein n=1 Tax=Rhodotorula pacifica TaxID=1495444 RepID=UPI003179B352
MLPLRQGLGSILAQASRAGTSRSAIRTASSSSSSQRTRTFSRHGASSRQARDTSGTDQTDSYRLAEQVRQLVVAASRRKSSSATGNDSHGDSYASALSVIRAAPSSAATVVVWNVLLNAVLVPPPGSSSSAGAGGGQHAAAVRRAYEIWMEMKRRGVVPTSRSYGTFLTGVAKRAKRAAIELERNSRSGKRGIATTLPPLEGWNADLRAKVETVHKQWRTHCERVVERSSPKAAKASQEEQLDGRHDSIDSLSPVPTNQYLSFLSAALSLSLSSPTTTQAGPAILDHLVRTFEAMPDPDAAQGEDAEVSSRLGRTTVSYTILYGAFKAVLQRSSAVGGEGVRVEEERGIDVDGLEMLSVSPSSPSSEFPTAQQILDRALSTWDHLFLHPPSPEMPSSGSSSSSSSSHAGALTPILPTSLLSLYLATPITATSTLPPSTHARFLAVPQVAFGFVPPSRIADLEPPHPVDLPTPLCADTLASNPTMDLGAFGAALRTASRAALGAGVSDEPTRWTKGWWDQVRDYPGRFGLTRGLGAPLGGEGVGLVGEERMRERGAAEEVIKAAGRAGDVESIEDLISYLKQTAHANPALTFRTHAPLVSTYTLAISSLSRIGTQPALSAAIRLWEELIEDEPPFVPSPARARTGEGKGEGKKVAKTAYAKAAYEIVRMAVMGVRERTAVWAAVKAIAGGLIEASTSSSSTSSGDASLTALGAFHPTNFPPPATASQATSDDRPSSAAAAFSKRTAELDLLARMLHNALGRIMSGDGRPGDLSAQVGKPVVKVLEEWRARIKTFAGIGGERGKEGRGRVGVGEDMRGEMAWRRRETEKKQAMREKERRLSSVGGDEEGFRSRSNGREGYDYDSPRRSAYAPSRRSYDGGRDRPLCSGGDFERSRPTLNRRREDFRAEEGEQTYTRGRGSFSRERRRDY